LGEFIKYSRIYFCYILLTQNPGRMNGDRLRMACSIDCRCCDKIKGYYEAQRKIFQELTSRLNNQNEEFNQYQAEVLKEKGIE